MDYYNEIKNELMNNEVYKKIKDYSKNRNEVETYYRVGKLLAEAGKHYGESIIKQYSKKLTIDLNIKYDISSLNNMKKFYVLVEKLATLSPILSYYQNKMIGIIIAKRDNKYVVEYSSDPRIFNTTYELV